VGRVPSSVLTEVVEASNNPGSSSDRSTASPRPATDAHAASSEALSSLVDLVVRIAFRAGSLVTRAPSAVSIATLGS
jgi:hypothetical protein